MKNPVDHDILQPLQSRWSPYAFDPAREVAEADLRATFEAARWAMSSYNEQPWRYIVGARGRSDDAREKVLSALVEGNRAWAQFAPVLVLGLYRPTFSMNGKENTGAQHDLGASSAFLTVEASARGLSVHQMIGLDPARAKEAFDLPDAVVPLTALAIGYHGVNAKLDDDIRQRDDRPRERKALDELVLAGSF